MAWLAVAAVAAVVALLAVGFIVAAYKWKWSWAGFPADPALERPSKTLWDWMQLLVIPLGLAVVAFALNAAQSSREASHAAHRAEFDSDLAEKRRREDRQIAADRWREDALSGYLQQMARLVLQREVGGWTDKAREVALTMTLVVLPRLDGRRKGDVVRFLINNQLITRYPDKDPDPILRMDGADLRQVVMHGDFANIVLDGAILRGADFYGAQLSNVSMATANLSGANFSNSPHSDSRFDDAILNDADFHKSHLSDNVTMRDAVLRRANFRHADFTGLIDFSRANLREAHFNDAHVSGDFTGAKLSYTDFSRSVIEWSVFPGSCISHARFVRAVLRVDVLKSRDAGRAAGHDVDFSNAHFENVDLRDASLAEVELKGAKFDRLSHRPDANSTENGRCPGEGS